MNTKVVYVLVSNKNDYYVEMLQLSLYSLRIFHPDDIVEVVMDEKTYSRLVKQKHRLLADVKPIVVEIPKEYSLMQRSRYLKTRLREIIVGDFIYLDSDTVIADSLAAIDDFQWDMAAVLDNHDGKISDAQIKSEPDNWVSLYPGRQFNCGVLFVKDTPDSHRYFSIWHENWKYCVSRGCHFDQPGFRKAYAESGIEIEQMSGIWNCQVTRATSAPFIDDAKVLHYQRAGAVISIFGHSIRKKGKVCDDAASFVKNARYFFSGHNLYLTTLEYEALDSFRYTLFNYPRFFRFLSALSKAHSRLIEFLVMAKGQFRQ